MYRKQAILTIDDAPSKDFLKKISILEKYELGAIFFCTGSLLADKQNEGIEAIKRGFIIGNHAWDHPHFSDLEWEEAERQVLMTDQLIMDLYRQAGIEAYRFFRFPYGDKGDGRKGRIFLPQKKKGLAGKKKLQELLRNTGYTFPLQSWMNYPTYLSHNQENDVDWHWTFDVMEWSLQMQSPLFGVNSIDNVIARMSETAPKDCRGDWKDNPRWINSPAPEIILLHDHEQTTNYFEELIKGLLSLGLSFSKPGAVLSPRLHMENNV